MNISLSKVNPAETSLSKSEKNNTREKEELAEPRDFVALSGDNSQEAPSTRYFIEDLEKDGYMDLIIQEPDEGIYAIEIDDEEHFFLAKPGTERYILPAPLFNDDWELVGTGDFDGTQTTDLLFQHKKTGKIVMYQGAGEKEMKYADLETVFSSEVKDRRIVATCDMNKDKRSDILWEKQDGTIHAWLMDGEKIVKEIELEKNPNDGPEWHIVGAGHFHSYGRNDLVVQKEDGTTKIEFYDGTKFLSEHDLYASGWINFAHVSKKPYPFDMQISCVGDVDYDGDPDILSEGAWLSVMKGIKEKYCVEIL